MAKEMERFVAACDYPSVLDEAAVETHLERYCNALGVKRKIVRLRAGWDFSDHPSLARYADAVLDDFAKRSGRAPSLDARDARAARDASDASDARDARDASARNESALRALSLHRFASWCIHRGWSWWSWDLSWIATTLIGAQQLGRDIPWARPLFEAYVAGAWMLFWTDDTLYWVAKPVVHIEHVNDTRRLHCEDGPAVESDAENLYFWHGVLVPAFVVVRPDWITLKHIQTENNAEVRRVILDRYGMDRYVRDTGALPLHADDYGTIYQIVQTGDDPLVVVSVRNSTAEPDGHYKHYMLRVDPQLRPLPPGHWPADKKREYLERQKAQVLTARNAVASLHGLRGDDYHPVMET